MKIDLRKWEDILLSLVLAVGFSACANRTLNTVTDSSVDTPAMQREAQLATSEDAHVVSRIQFEEGQSVLTPKAQTEINHAIEQARAMGQVDRVSIAVWSDLEYPTNQKQVSGTQLELAELRGRELENYFRRNFNLRNVRIHNMGKQPNAVARTLNSSDARIKEKLQLDAAISQRQSRLAPEGRASSALILVEVE